ncbi:Na+/H+ antiporter NhaA [Xanthomonas sp. XNM01]|uniref:Na+/H+ antiporter NhaA n=1 Tax=Xanthomonas sp. XNM01 TaxID=2769289 RepID=UPI001CE20389|nr:Na+/H+ antiporter NhaA [Xanthomonas sp. XNM01]
MSRLPPGPTDRLARSFLYFVRIEAMAGAALLASTLIALCLANSAWSEEFLALWETRLGFTAGPGQVSRSLKHWINDGLMTLFFFVISLELKRELVLGELRSPRMAALPIAAALGGMVVPVAVFLLLGQSQHQSMHGWGTVMSTDTAFVIGCLAALGTRVPGSLRLFLLSLAIFDDIGAILVVAIAYGDPLSWTALGAAGIALALTAGLARLGIRSTAVYIALGAAVWLAFDASGVHATVAGVILGLMTPSRRWVSDTRLRAILRRVIAHPPDEHWNSDRAARGDLHRAGVAAREALSPIERLELGLHPWVAFIVLPLFALANAGVPITSARIDTGLAYAIGAAFVIGKPLGIVLFTFLAVRLRIAILPPALRWRVLVPGSILAGIGFTMALFIAELAFDADSVASAKLGVLVASVICAVVGLSALLLATRTRGR